LRIDEHDIDHREERGQAGDKLGPQVAARFAQAEQAIENGRRALAGSGALAHGGLVFRSKAVSIVARDDLPKGAGIKVIHSALAKARGL
jgi:hypothetical protein